MISPLHIYKVSYEVTDQCSEEEREPDIHFLCMHHVSLVTSIRLHYTKIMVYLLMGHTTGLYCL